MLRRYGLRTIFVVFLILSIFLAALIKRANDQSRAVEELVKVHARVMYDYQETSAREFDLNRTSTLPEWLHRLMSIDQLHTVIWVDLDSPVVTDETLKQLRRLPSLKVLHISNTSITDAGLSELTDLRHLNWLTLNTAGLSDSALVHVGKLDSLQVLEINGAAITDAGMRDLRHLRKLEQLTIEETNVTSAGISYITKVLDGCEIDHRP